MLSMAAQAKQQEQSLRSETNGILHAALTVELDLTIKRKANIFYTLGVGVRERQGLQSKMNVGFSEAISWWSDLASGGDFDTLVDVFLKLRSPKPLLRMGFTLTPADIGDVNSMPDVLKQNEVKIECDWMMVAWEQAWSWTSGIKSSSGVGKASQANGRSFSAQMPNECKKVWCLRRPRPACGLT